MKINILLPVLLIISVSLFAQEPTAAEIKKMKIKKMIRQEQKKDIKPAPSIWYFDAFGNDTAMYSYGSRAYFKKIDYDTRQNILTLKKYADNGKETEITTYTYKTDGSFSAVNKDKEFGLVTKDEYNNKGLKISTTIPDGSIRRYVYNSKNQLTKLYAEPKNGGIAVTNNYTYNGTGKLIKQVNEGDYPSTTLYEYDSKGLLKKSTITSGNEDEEREVTVYNYSYEY